MAKVNKRNIPRTQLDVDRARQRGMEFGAEFCLNMVLYVLKEKHNAPDEDILQFRDEFMYQMDSISKGYMTYADVKRALKSDYNLTVNMTEKSRSEGKSKNGRRT